MGQQQLLLIILGVIIVGVAIAVGISMFSGQSIQSNKDAILSDLNNLGADAYQWKIRPSSMGGGNGVYDGSANGGTPYAVKATGPWGTSNPNATYAITAQAAASITFTGTSKTVTGSTVAITFDANGKGTVPTYTGQFL
jgi:type II secretory pathway pseudopilin PulG